MANRALFIPTPPVLADLYGIDYDAPVSGLTEAEERAIEQRDYKACREGDEQDRREADRIFSLPSSKLSLRQMQLLEDYYGLDWS